jgi:hypothetical protein
VSETTTPVLPKVGDPAPDFTLPADDGSTVSLASLRGKNVVLWFYPKDDTQGCPNVPYSTESSFALPPRKGGGRNGGRRKKAPAEVKE